jgi:hypothetical protein
MVCKCEINLNNVPYLIMGIAHIHVLTLLYFYIMSKISHLCIKINHVNSTILNLLQLANPPILPSPQ